MDKASAASRLLTPIVLLATAVAISHASTTAITAEGRKVLLGDDGTWTYVRDTASGEPHDFRGVRWGISASAVAMAAPEAFSEATSGPEHVLWTTDALLSAQYRVEFVFVDDVLIEGRYLLADSDVKVAQYAIQYAQVEQALNDRYDGGSRTTNWTEHHDPTKYAPHKMNYYKADPDLWGRAIDFGYLELLSTWETETTKIVLRTFRERAAKGENRTVLMIRYSSKDLEQFAEEARKAKRSSKF